MKKERSSDVERAISGLKKQGSGVEKTVSGIEIYRRWHVRDMLGLAHVSSVDRMCREGRLLKPRKLGRNFVYWIKAEFDKWLCEQPVKG